MNSCLYYVDPTNPGNTRIEERVTRSWKYELYYDDRSIFSSIVPLDPE